MHLGQLEKGVGTMYMNVSQLGLKVIASECLRLWLGKIVALSADLLRV